MEQHRRYDNLNRLKKKIDELIQKENFVEACLKLKELWKDCPSLAVARFVSNRFTALQGHTELMPVRIAILRSYTLEPAVEILKAGAFASGLEPSVYIGEFNTYAQDIFDEGSELYGFKPDVVFLSVLTRSIAPSLWYDFSSLKKEEIEDSVGKVVTTLEKLVRQFRSCSHAHLVIHTMDMPLIPCFGLADLKARPGQKGTIRRINLALSELAASHEGVHILDTNEMIASCGNLAWEDREKWITLRLPLTATALAVMADGWLRYLHPLMGRICKVLVCDLDNTLWGGVIGEDGFDGIQLGDEYPGAAYQALQRAILDLYNRGVILAICSKNNEEDAMEVIRKHPGMLLRPEHFAAQRINWNNKSRGIQEIAEELNIGTSALAFLDDNPNERELVCMQMPEITVIDLPDNPVEFELILRRQHVFERISLTEEDLNKGELYAQQLKHRELQRNTVTIEEYLQSLEMEMEIVSNSEKTLERVAQLTQKTNQFNMTTKRYSIQQIKKMVEDPGWSVFAFRIRDRLGDNGIVGVTIVSHKGEEFEIDTFLMSCRVIGRTVETAMLDIVVGEVIRQGVNRITGWIFPTKKNIPARDFYRKHGFSLVEEKEGAVRWELGLSDNKIECPQWIKVVKTEQERGDGRINNQ